MHDISSSEGVSTVDRPGLGSDHGNEWLSRQDHWWETESPSVGNSI